MDTSQSSFYQSLAAGVIGTGFLGLLVYFLLQGFWNTLDRGALTVHRWCRDGRRAQGRQTAEIESAWVRELEGGIPHLDLRSESHRALDDIIEQLDNPQFPLCPRCKDRPTNPKKMGDGIENTFFCVKCHWQGTVRDAIYAEVAGGK